MGAHSKNPNETVSDVDLSDEAVWLYDEVLPDVLDDGKLTKPNADRLKQTGEALVKGVLLAVAVTVGPAVWSEVQGGNYDFPSLLNTGYTVGVATVISFFRTRL